MLSFHENIVSELVQQDGLVVMAAGLGLQKVMAALFRLHAASKGVLLILSTTDEQRQALREEMLEQDSSAVVPREVNNEFTSGDRVELYKQGGALFITSRILIVDMLNDRVPLRQVAGIVVNNCHRVTETCAEAFILRLYRTANKEGYVRAFSDKAQAMAAGFNKAERVMKSLFLRRLYLWPRFQLNVASALERAPPEVIDIRVPLTPAMGHMQHAIVQVMDACLKELKKTNRVDVEDLTVENGLFKSFDEIVRRQLDPIWHTIGRKTKQLVTDLGTLRKLAEYLLRLDGVTLLRYLDTVRATEAKGSVWIFAPPTHRIFDLAKRRVYQVVRSEALRAGVGDILPPDGASPADEPAKAGASTAGAAGAVVPPPGTAASSAQRSSKRRKMQPASRLHDSAKAAESSRPPPPSLGIGTAAGAANGADLMNGDTRSTHGDARSNGEGEDTHMYGSGPLSNGGGNGSGAGRKCNGDDKVEDDADTRDNAAGTSGADDKCGRSDPGSAEEAGSGLSPPGGSCVLPGGGVGKRKRGGGGDFAEIGASAIVVRNLQPGLQEDASGSIMARGEVTPPPQPQHQSQRQRQPGGPATDAEVGERAGGIAEGGAPGGAAGVGAPGGASTGGTAAVAAAAPVEGAELEVVLEEMPKWRVLREVLEEIAEDRRARRAARRRHLAAGDGDVGPSTRGRLDGGCEGDAFGGEGGGEEGGAVLVACRDERTCMQLEAVVAKGARQGVLSPAMAQLRLCSR